MSMRARKDRSSACIRVPLDRGPADGVRWRHDSPVIADRPSTRGASVGFTERLLEVIDSGRRTATYKLALLIALLDLSARHSDIGGRAPRLLYTRDIAEQVAVLYWPQVIPYVMPGSASALELNPCISRSGPGSRRKG